jgi:hypothetical protein
VKNTKKKDISDDETDIKIYVFYFNAIVLIFFKSLGFYYVSPEKIFTQNAFFFIDTSTLSFNYKMHRQAEKD